MEVHDRRIGRLASLDMLYQLWPEAQSDTQPDQPHEQRVKPAVPEMILGELALRSKAWWGWALGGQQVFGCVNCHDVWLLMGRRFARQTTCAGPDALCAFQETF